MSKLLKISTFFLNYIYDKKVYYLSYLGIIGIFGATYFLYDIPIVAYWDALLFSSVLLVFITVRAVFKIYKKHQLLAGFKQNWPTDLSLFPETSDLVQKDYYELIKIQQTHYLDLLNQQEQMNSQLLDYYGNWSHQIKTPMSVLELMLLDEDIPREIMKQELFKINQYLEMMLQYIRLNHSGTDFVFEEIAIKKLVSAVVKKYSTFFIYQNLSLELGDLDSKIITDERCLGFIIEQVLSNSLKYTKKGKIKLYLNSTNQHQLVIEDTGIGILPEDIPRVFEKGFTGFNGRIYTKATGLGLYMSKIMAGKLGYKMRLVSKVGEGTKVTIDYSQNVYELD